MKPNIGLKDKQLKALVEMLSTVLSNEVMLYMKTRKFHWNVCGESFMELHKLFESHYKEIEETIDEVAERISKIGGKAIGTTKEYGERTLIKETPGVYPSSKDMIKELLADHENIVIQSRDFIKKSADEIEDAGTADFLTKLMQTHETISWTLRRYFI
jgi:starvation-inducible DNA-binding protein